MKAGIVIAVLLMGMGCVFLLAGNSKLSFAQKAVNSSDARWSDEPHVVAQVCDPSKTVVFQDIKIDLTGLPKAEMFRGNQIKIAGKDHDVALISPDQGDNAIVRRWIPGSIATEVTNFEYSVVIVRNSSELADWFRLIGNTEKSQPVYGDYDTQSRPQDILAFEVMESAEVGKNTDKIRYFYKVPQNVSQDSFTSWQSAISEESQAIYNSQKFPTDLKLLNGKEIEYYPVSPGGPMMRFKIMTQRDFFNANRFWLREWEAIRKKYYAVRKGGVKSGDRFVSLRSEVIPSCESTH